MSAITSIKNPTKKIAKPIYKRELISTPFELEMAVSAHAEHIETHIPCRVQVIKNLVAEVLISLNLLSSPAFLILKNKKLPSRIAQIIIAPAIKTFPILTPFNK